MRSVAGGYEVYSCVAGDHIFPPIFRFASQDISRLGLRLAAGCAAAARRAVQVPITGLGYALGAAFCPTRLRGSARTMGLARETSGCRRRGRALRLTSGGEAVTCVAHEF